jgi:3-oxoacyl-[acyl-carrier-protein] synthase II
MRRVVITGYGAVSPCGLDAESSWRGVVEGQSGIAAVSAFDATGYPSRIAGECRGFNPENHIPKRDVRSMDRFIHLAMGAADETMARAQIAEDDPIRLRTGTLIGSGIGGIATLDATSNVLANKGPTRVSPYFIPSVIGNLAPGQVSMKHHLKGISYTPTSACSSGAHAIGEAFRAIARGDIDACVAGGAEAAVTPLAVAGFAAMRALSKRNDAPAHASRPWDVGRDGFVIAEGAALVFLEEREHALARGATIYAEVVGYGASADAYHLTQPAPEGEGAQRAMRAALEDARLAPAQIDYLNAHGTSTPVGDLLELQAIRQVFGSHAEDGLWVSSTKSATGHLLGAAGGLEGLFCVLALRDGVVPPTLNLDEPEPDANGLELVPHTARERKLRYALSNSFGFGGTNVSLVFAKV